MFPLLGIYPKEREIPERFTMVFMRLVICNSGNLGFSKYPVGYSLNHGTYMG